MATLTLRVITPERIVVDRQVDFVRLRAVDGELGVLPRHAPLVAALANGLVRYRSGGERGVLFCAGGFAEVHGDTLRIVTQAGELAEDIDEERAREAEQRARERLDRSHVPHGEPIDLLRAETALQRALLRLQARSYGGGQG